MRLKNGVARFGRRFKKPEVPSLAKEDVNYLMRNTRYSEQEIREWFR